MKVSRGKLPDHGGNAARNSGLELLVSIGSGDNGSPFLQERWPDGQK